MAIGETRTRVGRRHALIAPDGHVPSVLPGVSGAVANVIISPAMGANVTQILLTFESDGHAEYESEDVETFAYVMKGACRVTVNGHEDELAQGSYAFAPAGQRMELAHPQAGTKVTLFQKYYEELEDVPGPAPVIGDAADVEGLPFLGDPDARLKTLLPDTPSFDMAVNVFTYQPGARLPFVETHIMEHGLVMLSGEGVYRLEDNWYPVTAGDAIWMAPYCPQWFVAMGKQPASYLYYKDINRNPLE